MRNFSLLVILFLFAIASCKTQHAVVSNTPAKIKTDTVKQIAIVKDSVFAPKQKVFRISLLLPLNLEQQFAVDSLGNESDILPSSLNALSFYEGFLLALDSLKEQKVIIQYNIFDSERDSISLWKLLNSEAVSKSDVVMAMLTNSWNTVAAKISSIRHYPLVLLLGNNSGCLVNNEQTFLVTPVNNTQCKEMAGYLCKTYPNSSSLVIYRENNKKETDLADLFYAEIDSLTSSASTLKINNSKTEFIDIKSKLVKTKRNILVIPSSDESYISSLLNKLSDLKDYNFVIAGLPTWEHFESIDPSQLETLNTHIFNANYIDYKSESVKNFRKRFIESYHTDPLYTAFQAYDLTQWLLKNMNVNNFNLNNYREPVTLTAAGIKPLKICENCGFENVSIAVLKYKNNLLLKVNH